MRKNLHIYDRVIRVCLAAVAIPFLVSDMLVGVAGLMMAILSVVFLATAIVGFCPLYAVMGLSSKTLGEGKE